MNILLINEDYIKANSVIDNNLSGKYLQQAILDAQNIHLEQILGTKLLVKIESLVQNGEIFKEPNYKLLLDSYITDYLLYQVLSSIIIPVSYKIANAGLVTTSDDKLNNVDINSLNLLKSDYTNKANVYKARLQNYLLANRDLFPELNNCSIDQERPNLYSSSDCGIWLGGERGKYCSGGIDYKNLP